jgi:glycosyltransferase involved in cell wall biosynthesis
LARQIIDLLDHPEAAASLAQRGQALVQTRFNWSVVGSNLAETYARIIARHRRGPANLPQETSMAPSNQL